MALGLAIVKQIAELHGGTVRAESAGVGAGAVLEVKLPLSRRRPADLSDAAAGAPGRFSMRLSAE